MTRLLVAMICAVVCLASLPSYLSAQDNAATVRVVPPQEALSADTGTFEVEVVVEGVGNLGAFQFVLTADPSVATAQSAVRGDFLGSSGREVYCAEPTIEDGAIRVTCVTLGQVPERGADGNGLLATITFQAHSDGTSALALTRLKLNEPSGTSISVTSIDGEVHIKGDSGSVNIPMLAGGGAAAALVLAGGVFVAMRRRNAKFRAPATSTSEPTP